MLGVRCWKPRPRFCWLEDCNISPEEMNDLLKLSAEVGRILNGLIGSI
jgi:hypothetical protein